MAFILDCSMALAWIIPDEKDSQAQEILERLVDEGAIVPGLWSLEVANVLLISQKRGRLTHAETESALENMATLPIEIDGETNKNAWGTTIKLAMEHNLTAYDAAYLELAMRKKVPLATLDKKLHSACVSAGIKVL